jgi:hypothetical protein
MESKMIHLIHDIHFAFRRFMRAPVPFLATIVTLTLGIGANTAIFSLVDGIWLRPLPIADPSHLVAIQSVMNHAAPDSESGVINSSYSEFTDIRERVPAFADVAASNRGGVLLETPDGPPNATGPDRQRQLLHLDGRAAGVGASPG